MLAVPARRAPRARAARRSCSRSRSATPVRRAPRRPSGWHRCFAVAFALVLLGEPLVAGIARRGASSSSPAASCSRASRGRPEHVSRSGSSSRSPALRLRHARHLRPLARPIDTDVAPGARDQRHAARRRADDPRRRPRQPRVARASRSLACLPAGGAAVRALLRLSLRGVLPRPAQRRLAARRDRVALGRRPLRALPAAASSASDGGSCSARASSSPAGVLIGFSR